MEDYIQRCNFDIYGVGGIITTYRYVKWLCDLIKKYHPYSKVVVGGALATTAWRIIAPYLNCDHFIIGEGEYAIQNIVGLHDKILFQPVIQNLDELPLPDYENLPTLETYLKNPIGGLNVRKWVDGKPTSNVKNVNIITARGCPYHCYFCTSHYLGRGYRRRSLDKVLEEIELLKARYDVKYIHFTDELTFTTPSQTLSMARELAKLNILWGAPVRIDLLDEELMKVMSEAGCIHIGMGVESFSKQMLERMNKPMNLNQVKENLKKAQKIIQDVKYTLIIGFPGEDEASLKETLQGVKEVGLKPENVFYATPYPQTWLWEYALREGFIKDEEKFLSNLGEQHELKVNFTGLKDEELKDWRVKILEDG